MIHTEFILYFSDVYTNFYEFLKFIWIYGLFKRVKEFWKDKPANGTIPAHRPRPSLMPKAYQPQPTAVRDHHARGRCGGVAHVD
jgi:hypothetical protein